MSIAPQPAMLPRPSRTRAVPGRQHPGVARPPVRRKLALLRLGVLVFTTACAIASGLAVTIGAVIVLAGGLVG